MLELVYSTGLRCMEVAHLALHDFDAIGRLVLLREGKGAQDRVVPVGRRALAWLERYLLEARPQLITVEIEALFMTDYGEPTSPEFIAAHVKRYMDFAGARSQVPPICYDTPWRLICSKPGPLCACCKPCSATPISTPPTSASSTCVLFGDIPLDDIDMEEHYWLKHTSPAHDSHINFGARFSSISTLISLPSQGIQRPQRTVSTGVVP